MDLKLLKSLVRLMERGEVNELEIEDEKAGVRIHLRRGGAGETGGAPLVMLPGGGGQGAAAAAPAPREAAALAAESTGSGLKEIKSPMVGTFYRSASPDADPFVSEGARVGEDDVVCIIEAMKVMNEIKAECQGEIVEILVENGDPVEFGQPMFLVRSH